MEKVKIFTVAHVPPALEQAWLQHLRDFDTAHAGCHFESYTLEPADSIAALGQRTKPESEDSGEDSA